MRVMTIGLAIAALAAAGAAQQSSDAVDHVFHFTNATDPQSMQAITNAVRSILELTRVSFEAESKSLVVHASPEDIASARWIFQELDVPKSAPPAEIQAETYPVSLQGPNSQMQVLRLSHVDSMQMFQEIVNAIRTIPDITQAFPETRTYSIVVRADPDSLALAGWLAKQLDLPASPGQQPAEAQFHSADTRSPETRVIYLAHASPNSPQAFQEILNATRVIPQLTKVFPVTSRGAIAIRGTAEQAALAEWLIAQVDKVTPAASSSASVVQELKAGVDVVQLFFLPGSVTSQSFQETVNSLRTTTQPARVFPCTTTKIIALRGTFAQLAEAAWLLKQTGKL